MRAAVKQKNEKCVLGKHSPKDKVTELGTELRTVSGAHIMRRIPTIMCCYLQLVCVPETPGVVWGLGAKLPSFPLHPPPA